MEKELRTRRTEVEVLKKAVASMQVMCDAIRDVSVWMRGGV